LLAVDRAKIAPLGGEGFVLGDAGGEILDGDRASPVARRSGVRPLVPDLHALLHQRADVGLAGQEPQQLSRVAVFQ
jgi:hypothetical protein